MSLSYADETAWMRHRLCGEEDSELFFPIGKTDAAKLQRKEIDLFCTPCPVQIDCLFHAMRLEWDRPSEAHGYYGNRSETTRKKYIAELKKKGLTRDELSYAIVSRLHGRRDSGRRRQRTGDVLD